MYRGPPKVQKFGKAHYICQGNPGTYGASMCRAGMMRSSFNSLSFFTSKCGPCVLTQLTAAGPILLQWGYYLFCELRKPGVTGDPATWMKPICRNWTPIRPSAGRKDPPHGPNVGRRVLAHSMLSQKSLAINGSIWLGANVRGPARLTLCSGALNVAFCNNGEWSLLPSFWVVTNGTIIIQPMLK